jgi:predicted ribonuclease YlaK
MADIIGSETELDRFIEDNKIKLEHIGFVRGRSFKNSAVVLSEAQNITQEQMAIIVSRIGENSILIVEGDLSQCDKEVFRKESGLVALIESLKGCPEFGVVTLTQNERSKFSALADKVMKYNNSM